MPGTLCSVGNRFLQGGLELREVSVAGNATHAGLGFQECQGHPSVALWRMMPPFYPVNALDDLAHQVLNAIRGLEVEAQLLEEAQAVTSI